MKGKRKRRIDSSLCRPLLGALEAEAMEILWKLGEASVREVMQRLSEPSAYTTVMTTLTRMFTKGLLCRRKSDSKFIYYPRFTAEEWKRYAAQEAAMRFLSTPHTSRELLVSCLEKAMTLKEELFTGKHQAGGSNVHRS